MPDLPTPQDAAEAALFSECWDAVLSYADLCTAGSAAATELATEAFSLGMREAREAEAAVRGAGRRPARLPRIPLLLTAVRATAADWEMQGLGHRLDPDLRLWLNSDKAARYTGPPLQRPIALRGLRDLQAADAELLWLAEVEALPLPVVARRLGLDPATVGDELAQVRGLFRDRSHRNHLDMPMDAQCRSYARLLDAVTRSTSGETPEDLSRHLARCQQCAEAAACLRLHGGGLPAALAGGVIGWGGLAYLERRRRAAEVRLGAGRPPALEGAPPNPGAHKAKVVRNGLLVAAVLVSLLALAVSMMPGDDMESGAAQPGVSTEGEPVANPTSSVPGRHLTGAGLGGHPHGAHGEPVGVHGCEELRPRTPGHLLRKRRGPGAHPERHAGLPGRVLPRQPVARRLPGRGHRHHRRGARRLAGHLVLQGRPEGDADVGRGLQPERREGHRDRRRLQQVGPRGRFALLRLPRLLAEQERPGVRLLPQRAGVREVLRCTP
ncbi:hypothetical protein RKD46_002096 [Streptomyces pseudovenezuelae]